jgi:hypothetical protein
MPAGMLGMSRQAGHAAASRLAERQETCRILRTCRILQDLPNFAKPAGFWKTCRILQKLPDFASKTSGCVCRKTCMLPANVAILASEKRLVGRNEGKVG